MPYYLAPYVGAGLSSDPFRPRGSDQPGWRAVDLRPDASRLDGGGLGVALLYLPAHDPDPLLDQIVDARDEIPSPQTLTRLRSRLRLSLPAQRFERLVGLMLRQPPANGWKPLQPVRTRGAYEVWLDGLVYEEPFMAGGASDNFNRADEDPIQPPWTSLGFGNQDMRIVSNQVDAKTSGDDAWYYSGGVSGADQYAEIKQVSGTADFGPAVRMANAGGGAVDMYLHRTANDTTGIKKFVGGTYSTVANHGVDIVANDVVRIEAEGSTIRALINGVQQVSATDTSITAAGDGVGVFNHTGAADDWAGGAISAPAGTRPGDLLLLGVA